MGKKSTPSPPPAPNPTETIAAQSAANKDALKESARINAVDIYSPTGSVTYAKGDDGIPTAQHINVSDTAQDTINRQEQIANNLTQIAGTRSFGIPLNDFTLNQAPFDTNHAVNRVGEYSRFDPGAQPYDPRQYGDLDLYDEEVQDAYFTQQRRSLDPVWEQAYDRQQQDLANRGLPVGGEAYNEAMESLNRSRNDAYQTAANQAVLAGGQEASRKISQEQDLRSKGLQEDLQIHQQGQADTSTIMDAEQKLRSNAINENLMERNQNLNEISALFQGSPALQMPSAPAPQTYRLQAPDVVGTHMQSYNAAMQGYNAQQANAGSAWQGTANIATGLGSLAFKSSRVYKHDDGEPERILDRIAPIPVRTWRYRSHIDPRQEIHIGPYAEDWKAALGLGDGKEIAVMDAFGVCLKCIQELHDENAELKDRLEKLEKRSRRKPK